MSEESIFDSRQGQGTSFFSRFRIGSETHPALGMQWIVLAVSLGIKGKGCETDHFSIVSLRFRIVKLYIHFPICLYSMLLD
jgi:hypothetical protein